MSFWKWRPLKWFMRAIPRFLAPSILKSSQRGKFAPEPLRWIDRISAAPIVNFVWGTPPIPCYFEGGWVAPSKPKFKQLLTTSFRWPSHDVTRGVYISLHLEFRSSWTSCNIWVAFMKQVSLYSCNFEDTVNATFCCVTSISIFSVQATSMLQFKQLYIHISCCR